MMMNTVTFAGFLILYLNPYEHWTIGVFLLSVAFFHLSEFYMVVAFNPDQLDISCEFENPLPSFDPLT